MTTMTLLDGRIFPRFGDRPLSWSIGLYMTDHEAQSNYPRARAVIRAMVESRPAELAREYRAMVRASFDRMFGHNARRVVHLIECEAPMDIGSCGLCGLVTDVLRSDPSDPGCRRMICDGCMPEAMTAGP